MTTNTIRPSIVSVNVKMIRIDFTALHNIKNTAAKEIINNPAASVLNTEVNERQQMREVYRRYQDNTRKAELIKIRLLKGVKCGLPAEGLLKDAAECIGLLTGDRDFSEQVAADIQIVEGLQEGTLPKKQELQHRLELMKRCIENELKK